MPDILQTIAKNVRHYRRKKNLTQAQLAERTNHHPSYISNIENARINIYLTTLFELAKALKVKARDLVEQRG